MDPALKNRVLSNLKTAIPDLPRGLGSVAKYIIDHPSDFGLDPVRETARKAGVSTYTLIRLAERMGFSTFDELREPFRHALVSTTGGDQPLWMESLEEAGGLGRIQAEASRNTLSIVQRSLEHLDPARLQRVIDLLLNAEAVYLTAVRASYAMAFYLHYVGRMALPSLQLIPRHMNSAIDDLHTAREGDVMIAITLTPYSRETIEACQFARRKGLKLVLISDSEIVSPDFRADETLVASVLSTHHFGCYAGMMAVIETLLAMLVAQGGEAAQGRIQSYETLRQENNAYWVAPKGS
ncbi:RpiR family transcriptional regulator [Salinicola rhizosphaerae]|uniref:RpiR family transcriptional regulator n=1 Tax=Salinicola rhizosphaerae TaxID=1443141 RepID=A0ABQ3E3Y1_9GAMM|nr:RpiR family transcriptional regulator [Salinicola rhizosphaerae]